MLLTPELPSSGSRSNPLRFSPTRLEVNRTQHSWPPAAEPLGPGVRNRISDRQGTGYGITHFFRARSRNPHEQASALDRGDQPRSAVRAEDYAHVRHVLFHSPTERGLSVSRE